MDKITNQVVTDYLSTQLRNQLKCDSTIARQSKSIVSISVRSRYNHKIVNATLTHKRTGEVIPLPDIKLRTTGLWSRMGWFTLPDDKQLMVYATVKHGCIYTLSGKYPSSPGLAMPGSAYFITGEIARD